MFTWIALAALFLVATAALVCAALALRRHETRTYVDHIVYDPAFAAATGPSTQSTVHPDLILINQTIALVHPELHTRFFQKRGGKYVAVDGADFADSLYALYTPHVRVGKHSPITLSDPQMVQLPYGNTAEEHRSHMAAFQIVLEDSKVTIIMGIYAREGAIKKAWNETTDENGVKLSYQGTRAITFHVQPLPDNQYNLDAMYTLPVQPADTDGYNCNVKYARSTHTRTLVIKSRGIQGTHTEGWVRFTFPKVTWDDTFYKHGHSHCSFLATVVLSL